MNNPEMNSQTLISRIETLESEILQMSSVFESLHFAVMQVQAQKEDPVRIVVESVSEGLGISVLDLMHHEKYHLSKKDNFHGRWLPLGRGNAAKAILEDPVTRARVVVLFFLRFIFPQTLGSLKLNFSWFNVRQEPSVRRYWAGALSPKTPLDQLLRNETIKCQSIIGKKINLAIFI